MAIFCPKRLMQKPAALIRMGNECKDVTWAIRHYWIDVEKVNSVVLSLVRAVG